MASGLILDPVVLLRVAPLVSSTCTLLFASDQSFFLGLFNKPAEHRRRSRALLPAYFDVFFRRGVGFVLGCLAATFGSSLANLLVRKPALVARGQAGWWYVAGAVFALGHLFFVPVIAPIVKAVMDADKEGKDANAELDRWLVVNRVRMLTVDLAAWAACLGGVVASLQA